MSALGARLAGLSTVPASVFGLPKDQVRLLLSSAWSSSGSVSEAGSAECGEISLTTTTSRAAANAVARLLLRFGIVGAVSCSNDSAAASSAVSIDEFEDQLMFLEQIPVNGESAVAAAQLRSALRAAKAEKAAPGSSGMYNAWDEVRGLL